MNEDEKRYRIIKKIGYEEQISEENKEAIKKAVFCGISAAVAVLVFMSPGQQDVELTKSIMNTGIGLFNAGFSFYYLKELIKTLGNKTLLQDKLDILNDELKSNELQEGRGISL